MSSAPYKQPSGFGLAIRKYFLSAFVGLTFIAYAIHERPQNVKSAESADSGVETALLPTTQPTTIFLPTATTIQNTNVGAGNPPLDPVQPSPTVPPPTDVPTALPTATAVSNGLYRDGTYTGDSTNAFFGNVQVQVSIQGGKIADVQFLDYPQHRRTSQRINQVAMPYLKTEAIQAQNANVDIVSGATLTSQAFRISLQSALNQAHN